MILKNVIYCQSHSTTPCWRSTYFLISWLLKGLSVVKPVRLLNFM